MSRKKPSRNVAPIQGAIQHIVIDWSKEANKILPLDQWTRGPVIPVLGNELVTTSGKRRTKGRKKKA